WRLPRNARHTSRPGSATSTTAPCGRRARTSAPWVPSISSAGSPTGATRPPSPAPAAIVPAFAAGIFILGGRSARFEVEVDPHRHVVGRLFPAAHVLVDTGGDEAVGRLRRHQHVVD